MQTFIVGQMPKSMGDLMSGQMPKTMGESGSRMLDGANGGRGSQRGCATHATRDRRKHARCASSESDTFCLVLEKVAYRETWKSETPISSKEKVAYWETWKSETPISSK